MRHALSALCCGLALCAVAAAGESTVIHASRIVTMDNARPLAEAMASGADGRIVALGMRAEIDAAHPGARREDFGAATVVPGLIDAHGHLLGYGLSLLPADLVGTTGKADVIARLKAFEKDLPPGAWLLGRGWDQTDWPEDERAFPTAADLDAAFPERPVWLERIDGHANWANSAAMRAAGRDFDGDWQVEGGEVVRREGRATGVFVDAAATVIEAQVPAVTPEVARRALEKAFPKLLAAGLTGVHDAGTSREVLAVLRAMADEGALPIRVNAWADGDGGALADLCRDGPYRHPSGRLQMRAVKLYADGALGSRGALLLADYSDAPGQRGLPVTPASALESAMRKAKSCGVQVATHAIGDGGNRTVLDLYAKVLGEHARADHRWRIEHAQVVALVDIPRFHALGVVASVQPTHATSDMPWAERRVGPRRIVGGYAWRKFRDAGVRLALGSDFPVERIEPILGLHAAVSRQDAAGQPGGGWYASERLTGHEALRGFTLDAAWAGFMDAEVGALAPGRRADFTVLSEDPVGSEPARLRQARVLSTFVDGRPAYRAQ
ncbi:MAG: amidohydrolase [Pseudomonadota bacterium]